MATIAPAALVTGAPRVQNPFGLFSVLALRDEGAGRWQNGAQWDQEACDNLGLIGQNDCEDTPGLPKQLPKKGVPQGQAKAFTVYGWFNCTPMGRTIAESQALADRHLMVREQTAVEAALWSGSAEIVPNFNAANGFEAAENVGSFTDPEDALAAVEVALGLYGAQGVIHMGRGIATKLKRHLESRGGVMYTRIGTPVVVGGGYGNDKIVGTGPLFGYRSDIFTSSNRPGDLLDRSNNDLYAIAERTYLVGFDTCGFVSATITQEGQG